MIQTRMIVWLLCCKEKKAPEVILPTSNPRLSLIPADTWLERVEVTEALAADRYSHEKLREILKSVNSLTRLSSILLPPFAG